MAPPAVTCPTCTSTDLRRSGSDYTCNVCDARFHLDDDTIVIDSAGDPRRATTSRTPPWFGLAFVVVAGTAGFLVGSNLRPAPEPEPLLIPEELEEDGPIGPMRELVDMRTGVAEDGTQVWLATYRNVGDVPVATPQMVLHLYDGAKHLGFWEATPPVDQLDAGDEVPLAITVPDPPAFERWELTSPPPVKAVDLPEVFHLGVYDIATAPGDGGRLVASGTIKNLRTFPMTIDRVTVVGRDASGSPTSWATGTPDDPRIPPEGSTRFSLPTGAVELGEPVTYTAFATGRRSP